MIRAFTFLFLLLPVVSFAQPKGINLEVDEFTGDSVLTAEPVFFGMTDDIFAYFLLSGSGDGTLFSIYMRECPNVERVREGSPILLKTGTGDVVELTSLTNEISAMSRSSYKPTLKVIATITMQELGKLAQEGVSMVRIETADSYITLKADTRKKKREEVRERLGMFQKFASVTYAR